MKIAIVTLGLLAWIGCHDESKSIKTDVVETDATWVNQLASDGCSWHFSVISGDSTFSVVPNEASVKKIESVLGKNESYYSLTPVHIQYSLTGNKTSILCGWGKKATLDEIDLVSIEKR